MEKFIKEDLDFYLPKSFKGLSKEYILKCIFNKGTQERWQPEVGDIIVGKTGNCFVISVKEHLHQDLGGDLFLFGGGTCSRDGGNRLNETYQFKMNKNGIACDHWNEKQVSSFSDYRFVPYPHEKERF
jgi:hypothetical protein